MEAHGAMEVMYRPPQQVYNLTLRLRYLWNSNTKPTILRTRALVHATESTVTSGCSKSQSPSTKTTQEVSFRSQAVTFSPAQLTTVENGVCIFAVTTDGSLRPIKIRV